MSAREAQAKADAAGLDLVKIAPKAQPPVCKIMDFGKFLFEQSKREKEAKKNQKVMDVKEDFAYVWEFKVKNAFRDSSRMSIRRLRECIKILRDTNITLNSGGGDEKTILEQTVTKMLMTKN